MRRRLNETPNLIDLSAWVSEKKREWRERKGSNVNEQKSIMKQKGRKKKGKETMGTYKYECGLHSNQIPSSAVMLSRPHMSPCGHPWEKQGVGMRRETKAGV